MPAPVLTDAKLNFRGLLPLEVKIKGHNLDNIVKAEVQGKRGGNPSGPKILATILRRIDDETAIIQFFVPISIGQDGIETLDTEEVEVTVTNAEGTSNPTSYP